MDFDAGAVQGKNANGDDALSLEFEEDTLQNAILRPAICTSVDAIPFSETLFIELPPLHTCFHDGQKSFKEDTIVDGNIAALDGEVRSNCFVLLIREMHVSIIAILVLVSTGSNLLGLASNMSHSHIDVPLPYDQQP